MMAGEASHPRKNLKRAFKTIYLRFGLFFIGGALACGIVSMFNASLNFAYCPRAEPLRQVFGAKKPGSTF
jgi:amino acid transporter